MEKGPIESIIRGWGDPSGLERQDSELSLKRIGDLEP